jgi:hypothetical protein
VLYWSLLFLNPKYLFIKNHLYYRINMNDSKSSKISAQRVNLVIHCIALLSMLGIGYFIGTKHTGIPLSNEQLSNTVASTSLRPLLGNSPAVVAVSNPPLLIHSPAAPVSPLVDAPPASPVNDAMNLVNDDMIVRQKLSVSFRNMKSRGELPTYLNDLGLVGEGVEVGVRNGEHSKHILTFWKGRKLHMVDPWEHQDEKLYLDISNRDQSHQNKIYDELVAFMKQKFPTRHQLHRGYSVQVAKDFPDNSLDFIYLDARHDYDGVKEDLEAWWSKLKIGGVYAGHDFVPDGKIPAGVFGVQKAVWEFANKQGRVYQSISTKDKDGGRSEPQWLDGGWSTWYLIK